MPTVLKIGGLAWSHSVNVDVYIDNSLEVYNLHSLSRF